MKAVGRWGLAAVVLVVAGACGDEGQGGGDGGSAALDDVVACFPPCARLAFFVDEVWAGPPIPVSRRFHLGAIACMLPTEPRAEYPTRFEIDRAAQTVDFECDGKDGLHLVGHLTGISNFGESRAEGDFGPDTTLVLSATGEMAGWLGEVMDPAGTDLWREYEYLPRWGSSERGGMSTDGGVGILPKGSDTADVPSRLWFEFNMFIP
jgi:hypothetical protein